MIKKLLAFFGLTAAFVTLFAVFTFADVVDITAYCDYHDTYGLTDDDYYTADFYLTSGESITVASDTAMDALYICWETYPGEWTLTIDGQDTTCGKNGFLHEYVKLPKSAKEVKITINKEKVYIADIYGIAGDKPSWVQDWQTTYDKADVLVFSTHSDDEILFMGGILANYANDPDVRVQVAYLCEFAITGEYYRRHEQLNGLWKIGIRHYPQMGEFEDSYPDDEDDIYNILDMDAVRAYVARTIRRFKPQVLVTHDFNGEYGHPEHRVLAEVIAQVITETADASKYSESATKYGTWDVPKTYFHIYDEHTIYLDVHKPLNNLGGQTAFEIATAAYKEHQSQQWMWFYVSDGTDGGRGAPYSITDFGLYRTLVGYDTGNDILENITTYNAQEAAAAATTEETTSPETDESGETVTTEETTAKGSQTTEQPTTGGTVKPVTPEKQAMPTAIKVILIVLGVVLALLIVFMIVLLAVARYKKKKAEERRRKRAAAKKRAQQRLREEERRNNRGNN